MTNLVWLASYPKSGNTWVRAFLTAYGADPGATLDLDDLDGSHSARREQFDRVIGTAASDLTDAEIDVCRPAVYRAMNAEVSEPQFLKVHDRWRVNERGEPVFPADVTRQAVLIVRNPLSVVASYANHYGRDLDAAVVALADEEAVLSRQGPGLAVQLPQPIGSWSSHARSWLEQTDLPVTVVRYEDLCSDPAGEFTRIVAACGLPVNAVRVAEAIDQTRFDRLRDAEAARGFRERPVNSTTFFRQGRPDAWALELTPTQITRIHLDHGPVMRRLGYA